MQRKSRKSSNLIGPFLEKDGTIVQDSLAKAEKLREHYESVFSKPVEEKQIIDPDQFFGIFDPTDPHDLHLEQEQDIVCRAIDRVCALYRRCTAYNQRATT